ncbi:MAG: Uncharacterized protein LiPW39_563 [Parcubacteria group bacterium LiPW_39]|nr:MAG: Uncharacterized protein LiPW39_563 [Parcubacteria group bacterium LiPW_39]
MSIKKSFLEQKLFYRVAKVIFLILPLLVAVVLFLKGYISIPENIRDMSQKNILDMLQKNSAYIVYAVAGLVAYYLILKLAWRVFLYIAFGGLENDTVPQTIAQTAPITSRPNGVVPAIVILVIIAVIAILFQTGNIKLPKINPSPGISSHTYGASCTNSAGKKGLYGTNGNCLTCSSGTAVTNPINSNCSNGIAGVYCCGTAGGNNGGNGGSKCIPTGCGSLWRCSGSYYLSGVQIRVSGACFPSGLRPGDIHSGWSGTCRQCP